MGLNIGQAKLLSHVVVTVGTTETAAVAAAVGTKAGLENTSTAGGIDQEGAEFNTTSKKLCPRKEFCTHVALAVTQQLWHPTCDSTVISHHLVPQNPWLAHACHKCQKQMGVQLD